MQSFKYTQFTGLVLLFLSACTVSKDIPVPINITPGNYRRTSAGDSTGNTYHKTAPSSADRETMISGITDGKAIKNTVNLSSNQQDVRSKLDLNGSVQLAVNYDQSSARKSGPNAEDSQSAYYENALLIEPGDDTGQKSSPVMKEPAAVINSVKVPTCRSGNTNSFKDLNVDTAVRKIKTEESQSIATLPYKEFFKEEVLRKLIDSAVKNNYNMQIALKNIEAANLLLRQSKLGNLPEINLRISGSSSRPSDNSLNGLTIGQFSDSKHIEDYNAALGLSWEADIWKKIANQKKAAAAEYLQTAEARKAIQTRLVSDVAQGYYRLIMLDTQLEIARKNLKLNDSTLTIIRMQFDAGQVTSLAIQQAEAQELVAAGLVPQLEQRIALEENSLSILTGAFPGAIYRSGTLKNIVLEQQSATGFPAELLSLRPDVKSAELDLIKANASTGIAKANMYPSFNITASAGLNTFRASNWFNMPASLFGIVAGNIVQPIFQRKQLRTQYQVSMVNREVTVLQFRSSVLNALGEVSDELAKIEKLQQQYIIAEKRVTVVRSGLKNANLLFKSGMANYLEVINAQSNALQSELDLATVKTAQLNANVELYRALGGGWK